MNNPIVPPVEITDDPFVKLADRLGELEVVIGSRARPAVAQVREGLRNAIALRERGDIPGALAAIRTAMERLAALAGELDSEEGAAMRMIATQFSQALGTGLKGDAKGAVEVMRRKAGGGAEDDRNDW
ncbi:MAG TPA: hypothetical protein VMU16_07905 [Candidatus Binataceae bacterium]|nr:hypothetical protein [Candidatus Binataceae bacterium]